jgi:hypothetical protein
MYTVLRVKMRFNGGIKETWGQKINFLYHVCECGVKLWWKKWMTEPWFLVCVCVKIEMVKRWWIDRDKTKFVGILFSHFFFVAKEISCCGCTNNTTLFFNNDFCRPTDYLRANVFLILHFCYLSSLFVT